MPQGGGHTVAGGIASADDNHIQPGGGREPPPPPCRTEPAPQQPSGTRCRSIRRRCRWCPVPRAGVLRPRSRGSPRRTPPAAALPRHPEASTPQTKVTPSVIRSMRRRTTDLGSFITGDAVHQQTAGMLRPLDDGDHVAPAVQLVRCRQARRARAYHADLLPRPLGRPAWAELPGAKGRFDDAQLIVPDRNGVPIDAADAGVFARGGAHTGSELRESCWRPSSRPRAWPQLPERIMSFHSRIRLCRGQPRPFPHISSPPGRRGRRSSCTGRCWRRISPAGEGGNSPSPDPAPPRAGGHPPGGYIPKSRWVSLMDRPASQVLVLA